MSTIWLEENLRSVDQYRSAYQLSQHRSIYGTDQPIALVTGSSRLAWEILLQDIFFVMDTV